MNKYLETEMITLEGKKEILEKVSNMNEPDGEEETEPEIIGFCDCCGEPIFEDSEYIEISYGHFACCEECLIDLSGWADEDDEEELSRG